MATIRDKMGHLDTAGQIHDYLQRSLIARTLPPFHDLAIFQQQPAGFRPSLGLIVLHRQTFLDQLMEIELLQHRDHRKQPSVRGL
jgi:hypothetical protein